MKQLLIGLILLSASFASAQSAKDILNQIAGQPSQQQSPCPTGLHPEGYDPANPNHPYACQPDQNPQQQQSEQQVQQELAAIKQVCGQIGPVVGVRDPQHSPFGRAFARIIIPLRHEFPHLTVGVVHSEAINASTFSIPDEKGGFICFTDSLINMLGDEDEIAFVMAHEVGHALDRQQPCPYDKANADARVRASISTSAHTEETAEQRICEKRADEIGFNLFVQAGYSPYAAGGAFGRLEMFSGEVGTGFFDRMAAIGNNHPITADRIKDMHQMLASYCQLNPHRCQ